MPHRPCIVSLATAWGPKFGGINAFNLELIRHLAIQPGRDFDLYCVVLKASEQDHDDANKSKLSGLISLDLDAREFPDDAADHLHGHLAALSPGESWIWLGHDITSGELALQLRERFPGSQAALIHHMAFGAYQDFKKGDSRPAAEKREQQRRLFQSADLRLAVGPLLREQLQDLLGPKTNVEMLVPGLADPNPDLLGDEPPNNFTAFVAGRLGEEDDRIKQGALAVRGFGAALGHVFAQEHYRHSPLRKSPSLRMRGVPEQGQKAVRTLLEAAGNRVVNCDLAPFGEDREAYFRDLAGSSLAMMPSWHEGFGLVAWEAIACRVPVVIGEQSGVYRLLHGPCQGMGLGRSVQSVAVEGHLPDNNSEPNHSQADVDAVRDALIVLGDHINERKADACDLAGNLRLRFDYTWQRCAADLLSAMESRLGCRLRSKNDVSPAIALPRDEAPLLPGLPDFLQPPRPRPWRPDSGQSPAALLVARDQIIPFEAERDAVVERWLAWMADPATPRVSLRLVTGPGGMGKTRSALEALKRAGQQNWPALWLAAELPPDWPAVWRGWLAKAGDTPALLVLDYVEGRQDILLRLLEAALQAMADAEVGGPRLRLLLLARNGTWWPELHRHKDCSADVAALLTGPGNAGVEELPPWSRDIQVRESAYRSALQGYAAAQGLIAPTDPYQPDLTDPLYERPLHLHMAAIATLAGERPEHPAALLDSQLRREWRYWTRAHAAPATDYDDWADALAWLALTQGAPRAQAAATLPGLGMADADLPAALARAYPAADTGIGPLQPDQLAETLIRERLAARRGAALLHAALPDDPDMAERAIQVIARLAARGNGETGDTRWRATLVVGLAQAWPRHGQRLVAAAHAAPPGLGRLLNEAWEELTPATQEAIAPLLSMQAYSTPLLDLGVAVARALLRLAVTPAERAGAFNNLSVRLSHLGDASPRAEALDCIREAVALYRDLAQTQPAAFLPDLAKCLSNLANRLAERGDTAARAEAVDRAREAEAIHRELSQDQPSTYRPYLAGSLNNLSVLLAKQGDAAAHAEAMTCAREALVIRRDLAHSEPAAHLPGLAMSLSNLANRLAERGNAAARAEAVTCAREALTIRRALAQVQPSAFRPDLAMSLNTFANRLADGGEPDDRPEAQACSREAVTVYRDLVRTQPAAYQPFLAGSLHNLSIHLAEHSDAISFTEALDCAREAVEHHRDLVQAMPAAYRPALVTSLSNLSNRLVDLGDAAARAEALDCAREAIGLCAWCYNQRPATFERLMRLAMETLMRAAEAMGTDVEAELAKAQALFGEPEA